MVKVRAEQPLSTDGSVDLSMWVNQLVLRNPGFDGPRLQSACELSERAEERAIASNTIWAEGHSSFRIGLDMAQILDELGVDEDGIVAGIVYRAVRENQLTLNHIRKQFGGQVATLIDGVLKMAAISNIQFAASERVLGQTQDQKEQARRMLVTLVDDVRVALLKLADRTCALREIARGTPEKRVRLAREIVEIYAPLAHRLGIGYLKWELEDISFRYIEPVAYQRIAAMLDEKRMAREEYIHRVIIELRKQLRFLKIESTIEGRAKHIFSIWRKMREKGIPFSEVYDVRAVRILVSEPRDCYVVMGVVHQLWRNVPKEFDDYIAAPKDNGYRSLHTAVVGPEGKALEVQIRTHEMHEEAELGVCSHWRYKKVESGEEEEPEALERKLHWLRQVLDWQAEVGDDTDVTGEFLNEAGADRIYVFTPDGHVVDMTIGATPVDFAYRVHTQVGHKCRGAKVNGRVVPLHTALATGDKVEIVVGEEEEPRREWLYPHLGYAITSRARAQIRAWLGRRAREKNIAEGKKVLLVQLSHLGIGQVDFGDVLIETDFETLDDMFASVGSGDRDVGDVVDAVLNAGVASFGEQLSLPLIEDATDADAAIVGLGDLNYEISSCCQPVPGDSIAGALGPADIVAIHRQDCLQGMLEEFNASPIKLSWRGTIQRTFPVNIAVTAVDRQGLLYDLCGTLLSENTNVRSVDVEEQQTKVVIRMTIEVVGLNRLLRTLDRMARVSNVLTARRING
jgi:GTP pyrophosphokinase